MKKFLLTLFLLSIFGNVYAQNKKIFLYGIVRDSLGIVKNVNVFNLTSKVGTFTDDFGKYEILVSEGDSLRFSSVQHKDLYRVVTNFTVDRMSKDVYLTRNAIALEEVVIKNTYLQGILSLDKNKTPEDRRANALKNNLDLSKFNMNAHFPEDHISSKVKPPQRNVDPTAMFAGVGASAYFKFKHSEKLWALRRKLDYQALFPYLIKEELGENFFFNELKIPKEKYFHFLEYCNPLGVEDLYKTNKLKVITILKKESKTYLALLSKKE